MPTARGGLAAVTGPDGRIYAIGGNAPGKSLNTVEAYDPTTNTWATVANMPTARVYLTAATGPDGRIYAIGGYQESDGKRLDTVEAYDTKTKTWSTVASLPTARNALAAATGPDGRIYAIGGHNGGGMLNTVEAYNPSTNKWTVVSNMGTGRGQLAATTGRDGRIYVIGGGNVSFLNTVEALSFSNSKATDKNEPTPPKWAGPEKLIPQIVSSRSITAAKYRKELVLSQSVRSVAFSADGKVLGVGCEGGGELKLWNVTSEKEISIARADSGGVEAISFDPLGALLATGGSDKRVRIWDSKTGEEKLTRQVMAHSGEIRAVVYSHDGKFIVAGGEIARRGGAQREGEVRIWNADNGDELASLPGVFGSVFSLSISPDNSLLALATGVSGTSDWTGEVRIWDLKTFEEKAVLRGYEDIVRSVAFSPNGKLLAIGGFEGNRSALRPVVKLWDCESGDCVVFWRGEVGRQDVRVAFSPDGKTLAFGESGRSQTAKVSLYNVETRKQISQLSCQVAYLYSLAFSPDWKTLAAGGQRQNSGIVHIWDLTSNSKTTEKSQPTPPTWAGPDKLVPQIAASRSITSAKYRQGLGFAHAVDSVAFSPDGKWLGFGAGADLKLWNVTSEKEQTIARAHSDGIQAVCFDPLGGFVATGSYDKTVRIWDLKTGEEKLTRQVMAHSGEIRAVAYSHDGKFIVAGGAIQARGEVRIWNADNGNEVASLPGVFGSVFSLSISQDDSLLALATGVSDTNDRTGEVRIWDLKTFKEKAVLRGYEDTVRSVAFSPNGKPLAIGGYEGKGKTVRPVVKLWDCESGDSDVFWRGEVGKTVRVAFSPDGKTLAFGESLTSQTARVFLYDVETKKQITELSCQVEGLLSLAFSPDWKTLAASGQTKNSGVVHIWDLTTKALPGGP
jgi:WD40 repeat protein